MSKQDFDRMKATLAGGSKPPTLVAGDGVVASSVSIVTGYEEPCAKLPVSVEQREVHLSAETKKHLKQLVETKNLEIISLENELSLAKEEIARLDKLLHSANSTILEVETSLTSKNKLLAHLVADLQSTTTKAIEILKGAIHD